MDTCDSPLQKARVQKIKAKIVSTVKSVSMKESTKTLLILAMLFICFFLPPITEFPVAQQETTLVMRDVFIQTSAAYLWLSPAIHIATVLLLVAAYLYGTKVGRIIDAYFGFLLLFIAFSNHIATTENYGFVIITGNLVPIFIVGLFWMFEVFKPENEYVFRRLPAWRYWVVPLVVLAFWSPISPDLNPDLNPFLLLNSSFGVMYCPTTPFIVALLTLIYPRVNTLLLRVTSFVGLFIGIFNISSYFLMPGYTLWNLILHIPLITICAYGLLIASIVKNKHTPNI
jgi:hypothetical protein